MQGSESFLDKPTDELTEFLLRIARADAAPKAARERALQDAASAAVGLGALASTAALGSRTASLKGTSWLVAKWLAAGFGSGLLGIAVVQGAAQLATESSPSTPTPSTLSAPAKTPTRLTPYALQLSPNIPAPEAPSEPAPALSGAAAPAPAPVVARPITPAITPAVTASREPKSSSQPSNDRSVVTPQQVSTSSLTRELSLLERARSALTQHSGSAALQALNEYRSEFPHGSMQIEAAALRVEAVGQSGDRALAQRLARAFLTNFPSSPLAARVRAFSEVFVADAPNP
jgi:hypothetical protein